MKKVISYILIVFMVISVGSFVGCETFTPPKSKEVDRSINLFSDFDTIGFAVEKLVINTDFSGYMQYVTTFVAKDEDKTSQIMDRVEQINKEAYLSSDSELQDIYRAIYVQEKSITKPENGEVRVKVEFVNINYLKCGITVQNLEDYLKANPTKEENNHYKSFNSDSEASLYKINDQTSTYIVNVTGAGNQIPVTVNQSALLCYDGDLVAGKNDTAKFSSGDFSIVVGPKLTERWLIISAAVLAFVFISLIFVKFVVVPRLNKR